MSIDNQPKNKTETLTIAYSRKVIFTDPFCYDWLESLRSQATRQLYATGLLLFSRFHKTTPEKLAKLEPDRIKKMVMEYLIYLKKNAKKSAGKPKLGELSVNSIRSYMCGVQSFFDDVAEVPLPWKKFRKYYPEEVSNDLRAYTRQEIQKLLRIADVRSRVVILLMLSSGIRAGAINELKFKHIIRLEAEKYGGIAILKVYGESKRAKYLSLITPECLAAIEAYRQYRIDHYENIKDESPLVRDKFALLSKVTNNPTALSARTINRIIVSLLERAKLPRAELQPDHSFRRYFNTMAKTAGIDQMFKEKFMGHSIKLDDVYFDMENPDAKERIIREYLKAVNLLTMNEEFALKNQVSALQEELKGAAPKNVVADLLVQNRALTERLDTVTDQVQRLERHKQTDTILLDMLAKPNTKPKDIAPIVLVDFLREWDLHHGGEQAMAMWAEIEKAESPQEVTAIYAKYERLKTK